MHRFVAACSLFWLATFVGCSTLGLSTNPVAHTMTQQTKQVLADSPRQSAAVPRELSKQVLQTHYLEPGDEVLIESNDFESQVRVPADQQVSADGSLDLGKYGRVTVAGLTLEQAEQLVQSEIAAIDEKPASLNVRLIQSVQKYYVIGEVNSPGAYPLVGHETVLDGIVAAGGLTLRASACDMLLARPTDPCSCRVTLPVCYRALTQLGDTTTNYQLKPGDRIFVGRQTFWEEITQSCLREKSCERCSSSQRACCDPLVAGELGPRFAISTPADSSQYPSTASQDDSEPIMVAPLGDLDEFRSDEGDVSDPALAEPVQATPDSSSQLDGELDFGDSPDRR